MNEKAAHFRVPPFVTQKFMVCPLKTRVADGKMKEKRKSVTS